MVPCLVTSTDVNASRGLSAIAEFLVNCAVLCVF